MGPPINIPIPVNKASAIILTILDIIFFGVGGNFIYIYTFQPYTMGAADYGAVGAVFLILGISCLIALIDVLIGLKSMPSEEVPEEIKISEEYYKKTRTGGILVLIFSILLLLMGFGVPIPAITFMGQPSIFYQSWLMDLFSFRIGDSSGFLAILILYYANAGILLTVTILFFISGAFVFSHRQNKSSLIGLILFSTFILLFIIILSAGRGTYISTDAPFNFTFDFFFLSDPLFYTSTSNIRYPIFTSSKFFNLYLYVPITELYGVDVFLMFFNTNTILLIVLGIIGPILIIKYQKM
ncbi:MAG: hypothetical protein ACTSRG_14465 [Candidatus Helarchaeota archaeon]